MRTAPFLTFLASTVCLAHEPTPRLTSTQNQLWLATGLDGAITGSVGFARTSSLFPVPVALGSQLTAPVVLLGQHQWRWEGFARFAALRNGAWRLDSRTSVAWTASSTNFDDSDALELGQSLIGGFFGAWGSVAAEVAWEGAALTWWRPTERYRALYAGARSTLLGFAGGHLRAALRAGLSFQRIDVSLRGGLIATQGFGPGLVPFFATVSVGFRFGEE